MKINLFAVTAGIVIFLLGATMHLAAQRTPQQPEQMPANFDVVANLQDLHKQLADINSNVASANQQVINKLDQVLANQDNILRELEVVKVRASQHH